MHIDNLHAAFEDLATKGYLYLTGETCCRNCAYGFFTYKYGSLPDVLEKFVYYTEQDAEAINSDGYFTEAIYISWGGDAEEICSAIRNHGFKVETPTSDAIRIYVECDSYAPKDPYVREDEFEYDDDDDYDGYLEEDDE